MSRALEQALSGGIAQLQAGRTLEDYLLRLKQVRLSRAERDELRSLLETAACLVPLRGAAFPAPRAKASHRAAFLGQAAQMHEQAVARPQRLGLRLPAQLWRSLVAVALVLALVLSVGGGVARAAEGSLPGSPLYPLKLAAEDARTLLTLDPSARTRLYLHFADRRTDEMLRLAVEQRRANEAVVTRMSRQLLGAVDAAQIAPGDLRHTLLEQVIDSSRTDQERLLQARAGAGPLAQAMLDHAALVADNVAGQAQRLLESSGDVTPTPSATPRATKPAVSGQPPIVEPSETPSPGTTETLTASPTQPGGQPQTPQPGRTRTATGTVTATPSQTTTGTPTASRSPESHKTPTPSATASRTRTPTWPTSSPSRTASPTDTPEETPASTSTPEKTHTATATPGPSNTPTHTPTAVFRVSLIANAATVPATHKIHYNVAVFNDGEIPLTNVVVRDRWSPRDCVYYDPTNPSELTWTVGTIAPHRLFAVEFTLDTYSTAGGCVVTDELIMTCDQGSGRATQTTLIGPTPMPTATQTATLPPAGATATPTTASTPARTPVPTDTATCTPTPTDTETPTSVATRTALAEAYYLGRRPPD
jgi:hypothetical protein